MAQDGSKRAARLVSSFQLISDQVSKEQLMVLLSELEKIVSSKTSGAVVEFGCYIGTTSLFIRRLLDVYQDSREFHVYDSFEGLPEKSKEDNSPAGEQFKPGELVMSKKMFVHQFQKARLKPPVIHKAWFKDLTANDVPGQISFAFLDGDFYESIRDSLKLILPRMQKGGTLIIDDYAREALPGVHKAVQDIAPMLAQKATISHNLGVIHF